MYMYNPLFFFYTEKKLVVRRNFFSFSDFFFFFLTGIDTQLFVLTQKSDNFFPQAQTPPKTTLKSLLSVYPFLEITIKTAEYKFIHKHSS